MTDFISKIGSKLEEYGFEIFREQGIEDDEYMFMVEEMIIVANKNTKEITLAFQATARPDVVANDVLILKEIEEVTDIHVTDSFIFTDKQKDMIQGDEAFKVIKKSIERQAVSKYAKENIYNDILLNSENCSEC